MTRFNDRISMNALFSEELVLSLVALLCRLGVRNS